MDHKRVAFKYYDNQECFIEVVKLVGSLPVKFTLFFTYKFTTRIYQFLFKFHH